MKDPGWFAVKFLELMRNQSRRGLRIVCLFSLSHALTIQNAEQRKPLRRDSNLLDPAGFLSNTIVDARRECECESIGRDKKSYSTDTSRILI